MSAPASATVEPPVPSRRRGERRSSDRTAAALLLIFTALAILWANSPWGDTYDQFWDMRLDVSLGDLDVSATLHGVVNDALMAFFFFLVGLEVKREFAIGELTDPARARVPIAAAIAGLILPALIFLAFAASTDYGHAWGIVISTDTAFLLGALAIIGPRFPARLRTFLLTLAVVDDVGALLVIALFYNDGIRWVPLTVALVLVGAIACVRFLTIARGISYATLGVALWIALAYAGIHPTLAGVAVALLIPVFAPRQGDVERTAQLSQAFRESPNTIYAAAVSRSLRESLSINERLQTSWSPYISFVVLPVFALANAGVHLDAELLLAAATSPLTWGIIVALVVGKLVGIFGATALVRAFAGGQLAPGLGMPRIAGGAALSGIGFTISLFIVTIAIGDAQAQDLARVGVLAASVLAFLLGWAIFTIADRLQPPRAVGARLVRPVDPLRDHIRGPVDARYTIVEYGDFECPFCSRATGSIDAVFAQLGTEVRWVFRHLPLDAVHPHAEDAATAAEAAALQGRFYEMARTLFAHQDALTTDDIFGYAAALSLDVDRFVDDFHSAAVRRRVDDDRLDAEVMDLHSTPTFFVGDQRLVGPYDSANLIRALHAAEGITARPPRST
jgi:Na+/H+ antiporter NhaA